MTRPADLADVRHLWRACSRPAHCVADIRLVEHGTGLLAHGSPDGSAVVRQGPICFGHRRHSIVDLEGEPQSMCSTDRPGLISCNGEVYNFEAIEQDLLKEGRTFATRSDHRRRAHRLRALVRAPRQSFDAGLDDVLA